MKSHLSQAEPAQSSCKCRGTPGTPMPNWREPRKAVTASWWWATISVAASLRQIAGTGMGRTSPAALFVQSQDVNR
eukprot:526136-Amphidinium_carterae.1